MKRPSLLDVSILVLNCAIWGSAFSAIKVATEHFGPLSLAASRTGIAGLAMTGFALVRGSAWPRQMTAWKTLAWVAIFSAAFPYTLLAWAETRIDSVTAGLVFAAGPLLALVVSHLLSRDDRFSKRKVVGLLIGMAGGTFVVIGPAASTPNAGAGWPATLAVAACPISYAIAGNLIRRIEETRPDVIAAASLLLATLPLTLLAFAWETPWNRPAPALGLGALVYLGLFPTAAATWIRYAQIKRLGYTFVSFAGYLVPIFALLWGVLLLNESVPPSSGLGLAIILLGLFVANAQRPKEGERSVTEPPKP